MKKFTESCFGHFMQMKTVVFCGGFIHQLLLHQVESEHKGMMEFEFHGIRARFDKKAFAMVTGLNCGKFPKDSELTNLPYDLWDKFFGTGGPLVQSDFVKAFEELEFNDHSDKGVEEAVKCCMFFFLETVLIPGEKKRLVKNDNFRIIQNTKLGEKYPWGNLSYDATIACLRSRIKPEKRVLNYTVYGFPIAFQVINYTNLCLTVLHTICFLNFNI